MAILEPTKETKKDSTLDIARRIGGQRRPKHEPVPPEYYSKPATEPIVGAVERVHSLAAGIPSLAEETYRYLGMEDVADVYGGAAESLKGPQRYQQNVPWEEVKKVAKEKGLSFDTIGTLLQYSLETGAVSMPDMMWVIANLPSYVLARTGEILQERKANKGGKIEAEDFGIALAGAGASAFLERFGARSMLTKGPIKGPIGEMSTEGIQEGGIEYLAEQARTDAPVTAEGAIDRGLAGVVGAGPYSVAISTAAVPFAKPQETLDQMNKIKEEADKFAKDEEGSVPRKPDITLRKTQKGSRSYGRGMDNYTVTAGWEVLSDGEVIGVIAGGEQREFGTNAKRRVKWIDGVTSYGSMKQIKEKAAKKAEELRKAKEPFKPKVIKRDVRGRPLERQKLPDTQKLEEALIKRTEQPFVSKAAQEVQKLPMKKGAASQMFQSLKKALGVQKGAESPELEWMGLREFLNDKKTVTKEELEEFVRTNQVEIVEVEKGGTDTDYRVREHLEEEYVESQMNREFGFGAILEEGENGELTYHLYDPNGELMHTFGGEPLSFANERDANDHLRSLLSDDAAQMPESDLREHLGKQPAEGVLSGGPTTYHPGGSQGQYNLEGESTNYREFLLTLPPKKKTVWQIWSGIKAESGLNKIEETFDDRAEAEAFAAQNDDFTVVQGTEQEQEGFTSHAFDEPNIVAWIRFDERMINGKRTLFIEEIQSDWIQKAQDLRQAEIERLMKSGSLSGPEANKKVPVEFGYKISKELQKKIKELIQIEEKSGKELIEAENRFGTALQNYFKDSDPNEIDLSLAWNATNAIEKGRLVSTEAGRLYIAAPIGSPPTGKFGDITDLYEGKDPDSEVLEAFLVSNHLHQLEDKNVKAANAVREAQKVSRESVPDQPFKTDEQWASLAMKRMIRYAVENGIDQVAWTTGEQQVQRYKSALRKEVDWIRWEKTPEGIHLVGGKGGANFTPTERANFERLRALRDAAPDGSHAEDIFSQEDLDAFTRLTSRNTAERIIADTTFEETDLTHAIGKAMAQQIIEDSSQTGVIEGENITIDKMGMKKFYDEKLTRLRFIKQMKGRVGTAKVSAGKAVVDYVTPEDFKKAQKRALEEGNSHLLYRLHEAEGRQRGGSRARRVFEDITAEELAEYLPEAIGSGGPQTVHLLQIDPKMKQKAIRGMPMFSIAPFIMAPLLGLGEEEDEFS